MLVKEYEFDVKEEPKDENLWYTNEVVRLQTAKYCTDCVEKQESIDSLKVANHQFETECRLMKEKLDAKVQEVSELEMALERMKSAHDIEMEEMNLKIQSIQERSSEGTDEEVDDHFEVERLLSHKIQRGEQIFFVKWKGFNNRHNSWVKRNDLNCKKILYKYLKEHSLD